MTDNNYMNTGSILWDIAIQNLQDLKLDISRSLKVKVYGVIRMPTYDFLLVNNSKCMPISSILRDKATQNRHDFEFDLVKVDGAIRKPTSDFLFVNNSK